jgi:glycerate 2-kinase
MTSIAADRERPLPMAKIRNCSTLLDHGDTASRAVVLKLADQLLSRLDADPQLRRLVSLDGDRLRIGTREWDLATRRHLYVIGAGKAANAMARALDDILGARIAQGIVIVKVLEDGDLYRNIAAYVGGHPLPNRSGYQATRRILSLVDSAGPADLFIAPISGGSSALMNFPVDEIGVADEAAATEALITSGAGILEINAVRRHISRTNGGRLAERIARTGAELIGIGISDAVGGHPTINPDEPVTDYAGTPIGPDPTTLADARRVIVDHGLTRRLPKSVTDYLHNAGSAAETPKAFPSNTYFVLNRVPDSCRHAQEIASEMGIRSHVLTTFLEGESRDAGRFLAAVGREVQRTGSPFEAPCLIFAAGETTTTISAGDVVDGHGGPGHELAIGFALEAAQTPGACVLSIDTEGTDGTTSAAGGMADSTSLARAQRADVHLREALRVHASHEALSALGDVVVTGNTGTNLCDFNVLYVPAG